MELDGAPLPNNTSIQDFQQGMVGYIANAMEQSLLLPKDMADIKSMRQHEVFLGLKRDLAMVSLSSSLFLCFFFFNCTSLPFQAIQAMFRVKEMVNSSHQKMKEEEGR